MPMNTSLMLRVKEELEVLNNQAFVLAGRGDNVGYFLGRTADGLFAQNMLAAFQRLDTPFFM